MSNVNDKVSAKPYTESEDQDRLITRLAVVALYEDDEKAFKHLETDFGIKSYDEVLDRARNHPDFDIKILLSKEHQRLVLDTTRDPQEIRDIEKRLGSLLGPASDSLSRIIPSSFDDLTPYLSEKTINFFQRINIEKKEGDARVARKLGKK